MIYETANDFNASVSKQWDSDGFNRKKSTFETAAAAQNQYLPPDQQYRMQTRSELDMQIMRLLGPTEAVHTWGGDMNTRFKEAMPPREYRMPYVGNDQFEHETSFSIKIQNVAAFDQTLKYGLERAIIAMASLFSNTRPGEMPSFQAVQIVQRYMWFALNKQIVESPVLYGYGLDVVHFFMRNPQMQDTYGISIGQDGLADVQNNSPEVRVRRRILYKNGEVSFSPYSISLSTLYYCYTQVEKADKQSIISVGYDFENNFSVRGEPRVIQV